MNCYIYVPYPDVELTPHATKLKYRADLKESGEINRSHPDHQKRVILCDMNQAEPLRAVVDGDRVQVLIHGSRRRARLVGVQDPATGQRRVFNAQELAQKMTDDGLQVGVRVEIRLFTCWAGEPRTYLFRESIPFGGQLYAALRRVGHRDHTVIGYRGSMIVTHNYVPRKLVRVGFGRRELSKLEADPDSVNWRLDEHGRYQFTLPGFALASTQRVVFDSDWYHTHGYKAERYFR